MKVPDTPQDPVGHRSHCQPPVSSPLSTTGSAGPDPSRQHPRGERSPMTAAGSRTWPSGKSSLPKAHAREGRERLPPPSTFPLLFVLHRQLPLLLLAGLLLQVEQDSLLLLSRPVHEVVPDLATQGPGPTAGIAGSTGCLGPTRHPQEPTPLPTTTARGGAAEAALRANTKLRFYSEPKRCQHRPSAQSSLTPGSTSEQLLLAWPRAAELPEHPAACTPSTQWGQEPSLGGSVTEQHHGSGRAA